MSFYLTGKWHQIGTKHSLSDEISRTTGIPRRILRGASPLTCNVAQRMSWASDRKTTRGEDMAYCLMGLFDVRMSSIYGEGLEEAFLRLQEKILQSSSDQTLFLWTPSHDPYNQGLLATSPKAFCRHYDCFQWHSDLESIPNDPFDPYSTFMPVFLPQFIYVLGSNGDHAALESGNIEVPLDSVGILGPQGLQISLLAVDLGTEPKSTDTASEGRVFCLGVMCTAFNSRNGPAHQLLLLGIRLCPDRRVGIMQGLIPNRLGAMRRLPCANAKSQYISALGRVSLTREKVTISQIRISRTGPGPAVTFLLRGFETRSLVRQGLRAISFGMNNQTELLVDTSQPFLCRGGLLHVEHPCSTCCKIATIFLSFGVREHKGELWCHFQKVAPLDPREARDIYLHEEQVSARYNDRSHMDMKCGVLVLASVQPPVEEFGQNSIRIGFRTRLQEAD